MPHRPDRVESRHRLAKQIRQPMTDLRQLLERMSRGPLTEAQARILEQARRSTDTLSVAVSDLLDVCCVEDFVTPETEPTPESDEGAWIDPEVTRRLRILDRPGRPGVLGRLVGVWADRSIGDLEALRSAAHQGAPDRVARIASTWRGATQNLGGIALAEMLAEVEGAAARGELPSDARLQHLAVAHAATLEALLRRVTEEARWMPASSAYSSSLRSAS